MSPVDLKIIQQNIEILLAANNRDWLELAGKQMNTGSRIKIRGAIEKRDSELLKLLKRKWALAKSNKESK